MAMNPAHRSLCAWRVGPVADEERPGLDELDALIVIFDSLAMSKSEPLRRGKSMANQSVGYDIE
jgi:hypothetical protein